ncbi:MAG: hypothetical protein FWG11_04690 [Promicromonosporaceae bacterium]|nr:hypothetical protein [Promicromonosporaceae bacterium]
MSSLHEAPNPGAPTAPQYGAPRAPQCQEKSVDPGKTLGIVALVFSFIAAIVVMTLSIVAIFVQVPGIDAIVTLAFSFNAAGVGLVLGIVAGQRSRAVSFTNNSATAAITLSAISMVLQVVGIILILISAARRAGLV